MSAEAAVQTATLLQQKVGNSLSGVTNLLAPPERSDSMLNAGAASLPALVLQEVAELQDAGKSKDSANKRTLQKLEHVTKDLEDANKKIKQLEEDHDKKNDTKD